MVVKQGKEYRIKGRSEYFKKKYGTYNPGIRIEDRASVLWKGGWEMQNGNPACMLFGMRAGTEGIPTNDVWYGKVGQLGELVNASELEAI